MTTKIDARYGSLSATEIRLIRLNTDLDYPVSGQLEVVSLQDPPPYYTISHAWIPGSPHAVIQAGEELTLSKNLSTCIRRLQQLSCEDPSLSPPLRHIWIDNICINQTDTPEKSRQVALMKKIYTQSIRTIIWLGEPESALISGAWQLVNRLYALFKEQNPTAKVISDIPLRTYDDELHLALGLPPLDDLRWKYLKRLMSLRWFSRIWVVQEVVLSNQDPIILHGKHIHAWELLGWSAAWLRRSGYMRLPQLPEELRNVDTISNLRRSATPWPLAALISITQVKFQATDQRDKIYGLLGLAAECQGTVELPKALRPDYSLEVTQLYQRVARFLMEKNESLAMLTRAKGLTGTETRNNRQHDLALPSWCPDWSDFHSYNLGISTSLSWVHYPKDTSPAVLGFPNQYRASGDSKLELPSADSSAEDESILQLYGFKVDQVHGVHRLDINRARDGEEVDDFGTKMAPALELAMSLVTPHGALPWAITFIQSTTASQHQLNGTDASQGSADGAAWLWNFFQRPENIPPALSMISQLEKLAANGRPERYEALVRNFCFDRAFVTTSEGRMGIAPSNTQVGDVILVIPGGGVPYIARPLGQYWLFVGESYVDGLMEWQALQTCNGPRLQKQSFSFM
ncbi:het-6-heterokaryon incompatibility protein [Fusarium flagelliforme]|uniref:Het-6-heterokaryon incompatibility protein n=1 Tax=Fusarium flagelliforme TaxID=2675880 RepID=A0A395MCC1_9HYPO|nr:het-6-heterokaryon incompatibility protein [Fusarium flagelliforme]